jgi:2-polyprenyl-3-methyl-5-hydroxy-6-metoxy-1,4-benzoquinol methylase
MPKRSPSKSADLTWGDRLVVTGEGVYLRSRRLSQCFEGFLRRCPRLFLKEVDLSRLLMGGEHGVPSAIYARLTGDLMRPSRSILESPHVQLLRAYREDGDEVFAPGRFEATAYYQNAARCLELYGDYFAAKDPGELVEKARKFCHMADGRMYNEHHETESAPGSHVRIRHISYSDCYEVIDGHHRLAVKCVNGMTKYKCFVEPFKTVFTPLQQMIVDANWPSERREIQQPIPAPELAGWRVLRRCDDLLDAMTRHLEEIGVRGGTYLDIGCSYGWFVSRMASRGFRASGVDRDRAAISLGRLAYGLPECATRAADIAGFLNTQHGRRYDVVSCFGILHQFAIGSMSITAEEFIREVDEVTGSVLFLDTGRLPAGLPAKCLECWDAEYVGDWLRQHTTFDGIEVQDVEPDDFPQGQPRRHLFICRRGG